MVVPAICNLRRRDILTLSRIQRRVHVLLEVGEEGDRISRAPDFFIIGLIIVNTVAEILETVKPIYELSPAFFITLEVVSMVIFTVEYLLRMWACTADSRYSHPVYGRLRFAFTPLLLIDLLALLPFYLPFLGLGDLRFLRTLRLLAWAARLGRYFEGIRTLGKVLQSQAYELLTVVLVLAVMLVLASAVMYYAENAAQPDAFGSIPEAMWWSVITLTTVGYGDVSPVTPLGKVMAGVIAVMGIGMFALPAGILGSGFLAEIQRRNRAGQRLSPLRRAFGCRLVYLPRRRAGRGPAALNAATQAIG